MDSFTLLKFWRTSTGGSTSAAETIALPEPNTDDEQTDDEGPFFDLEFPVSDVCKDRDEEEHEQNKRLEDDEDEKDFNFTLNSSESNELQTISHSDDLFFKGQLVPLESLLKSATKFRVFILGLRKSKSNTVDSNAAPKQSQLPSKFFFVKFKVEEVPIVSLFTRESSSRNQAGDPKTMEKIADVEAASEEKTKASNSKEVVKKYLSKIKPLYFRVSKRYADKLRFSGPLVSTAEQSSEEEKEAEEEELTALKMADKNLKLAMPTKLRVVYELLGKSRSAVAAVSSPPSPPPLPQRRDDSLLQQEDGIQSAIAHCKLSFTATSKETESPLQLSKSYPVVE